MRAATKFFEFEWLVAIDDPLAVTMARILLPPNTSLSCAPVAAYMRLCRIDAEGARHPMEPVVACEGREVCVRTEDMVASVTTWTGARLGMHPQIQTYRLFDADPLALALEAVFERLAALQETAPTFGALVSPCPRIRD